jgi:plastocyanin
MARRRIRSVRLIASIAAGSALLVAGCSGGPAAGGDNGDGAAGGRTVLTVAEGGDPDPGPADVEIHNFRYEPESLTISAGDSVTWVNEGSAPHTVNFSDGEGSGTIRNSRGFTHTFDEPGEYEYWCNNHPGMEGTITVE